MASINVACCSAIVLQNFAAQAKFTPSDIIGEKFGSSSSSYSYLIPFQKRSGQVDNEEYLKEISAPVFEREEEFEVAADEGTYGEILPESMRKMVQETDLITLGPSDVFYDLGSGVGKVVAQFGCEFRVGKATGIELGRKRHSLALESLQELKEMNMKNGGEELEQVHMGDNMEFIHGDILDEKWEEDATVLFINAFCFSKELFSLVQEKVEKAKNLRFVFLCGQRFVESPDFEYNCYREQVKMDWSDDSPTYCELYVNWKELGR
jgi:hypothetical protein